jgi:UDP-3-O-[3-hydroxymyristoyl] glucosamine N-acyltransferase
MTQTPEKIDVRRLAEIVGGELLGDGAALVTGMAPLESASPTEAAFLANPRYEKHVANTKAAAVIVPADYAAPAGVAVIRCADPYFAFRQAMVALYGFRPRPFVGVHRWAYIDQRAMLGENVAVAQFVTISEGAVIGAGTVLYPGVFIGPHARIGRDCILHPSVTVYDHCILGDRVTVHANSVIGEDGFGYATRDGRHHKIPQAGWVEIGDDVEIGANCSVDRAAIGATRIGEGTKFSNQVALGHGAQVGRHNLLVAQVGIAGSTRTGDYCVFGGQSGVVGHVALGDGVQVAAQAGVTNDVPAGMKVLGSPADELTEARRQLVLVRKLPELRRRLVELETQVAAIKKQLDESADAGVDRGTQNAE